MRGLIVVVFSVFAFGLGLGSWTLAGTKTREFTVYSVYRGVNLGTRDEVVPKDFFVDMGAAQGVREGAFLKVFRRVSTYDLSNEQFYRVVTFPIAIVKVIHVENSTAIARLERMLPIDSTPVISPRAIQVGDLVRSAQQ